MYRRWWRRPLRYEAIDENLGLLSDSVSGVDAAQPKAIEAKDGGSLYPENSAGPPTEWDERPLEGHPTRQSALEIAIGRLGITSSWVRFYDPIPAQSLVTLPRQVAGAALGIAQRCDGQYAATVGPVAEALRVACKSLGGARIKIDQKRGYILLHWDQRAWCLLRFKKDLAGERRSERAAGCQFALLPEAETPLRRETAYFGREKRIVPSARRFVYPNPLKACREDHLPLDALFGVKRRSR
jgi:hypothetical protein